MDGQTTDTQDSGQVSQNPGPEAKGQHAKDSEPEKVSALQKFINGLFGGEKGADAAAAETEGNAPAAGTEGKTFTQAELDAAVEAAKKQWEEGIAEEERLKKMSPEQRAVEEQQKKDARIADLEGQLLKKELREAAVKTLEKEGYSAGLADMLDYSSREQMEETLKSTMQIFKDNLASAVQARLKGRTPEGLGGAASAENLLRDQIARNIRGL